MTTHSTKTLHPVNRRLERWRGLVDQALQRLLPSVTQVPQIVHEGMRYCVFSGGKRFRPLLVFGGCEAVGAPAHRALAAACAVELVHTYSLVHDDLPAMDNADERRGQPTCHRKFGEGNAILVGDALLTLAFELLGRNGTPQALAMIRTLGQACGTRGLIGGQVLDLQALSRSRLHEEEALRDIAQRKTGELITASVLLGGLAGGADQPQMKRLQRYGERIGLAFQLIDDLHDQEGLASAMGTERARQEARRLIEQAHDAAELFGRRAQGLHELANWLTSTA